MVCGNYDQQDMCSKEIGQHCPVNLFNPLSSYGIRQVQCDSGIGKNDGSVIIRKTNMSNPIQYNAAKHLLTKNKVT